MAGVNCGQPCVITFTEALCATSWCAWSCLPTLTPSTADEPQTLQGAKTMC